MPRAALSSDEIAEFRERICDAAFRLFASQGYAAVTMRAIALEVGCSPMTPYRYFANKEEIFALVRAEAFRRFADSQETAAGGYTDLTARLCAGGVSYVAFAIAEPDAYRLMFELDPGPAPDQPELLEQSARAWSVLRTSVGLAVDAGLLTGDADTLAHQFWASLHGLVSLHLSNKLMLGLEIGDLVGPIFRSIFLGNCSGSISEETLERVDSQLEGLRSQLK